MVTTPVLVGVAATMSATIVLLIKAFLAVRNTLQAKLVLFGVAMMVAMFVGAALYVAYPSGLMLAYVVGANMLVMVAGLVYLLSGLEGLEAGHHNPKNPRYAKYFAALLLLNEASMGLTFVEAQGQAGWLNSPDIRLLPAQIVASSINTYWFFLPIFVEMASTIYFVGVRANEAHYGLLAAALLSPTSFDTELWRLPALLLLVALAAYFSYRCTKKEGCGEGTYYLVALAASAAASYLLQHWLLYAIMSVLAIGWFFTSTLSPKAAPQAR